MNYYYYLDRTSNTSMTSSIVFRELNYPIKTEVSKTDYIKKRV